MKRTLLVTLALVPLLAGCDDRVNNKNGTSGTGTSGSGTGTSTAPRDAANPNANAPAQPDNTKNNTRDRESTGNNPTPLDQSNDSRDIEITAQIRRSIVDDDAMSTNAENIKIVTVKGAVTLRGVVDSQAEKDAIEAKAKGVAGVTSVDNQLEVKTN